MQNAVPSQAALLHCLIKPAWPYSYALTTYLWKTSCCTVSSKFPLYGYLISAIRCKPLMR